MANQEITPEKNFQILMNQVQGLGYVTIDNELSKAFYNAVENNRNLFVVTDHRTVGNEVTTSQLTFKRSKNDDSGYYWFNGTTMDVKVNDVQKIPPQYFRFDSKNYWDNSTERFAARPNFTYMEMRNLINGRSVKKDVVDFDTKNVRTVFVQADKNDTDLQGNYVRVEHPVFDVEKLLDKSKILNMQDSGRSQDYVKKVERGDLVSTRFADGSAEGMKGYISLNAARQTVQAYNEKLVPIELKSIGVNKQQGKEQSDNKQKAQQSNKAQNSRQRQRTL